MPTKTNVQAGGFKLNHNQGIAVKSGGKAGGLSLNHCEALR
jgi:hypothetical protein